MPSFPEAPRPSLAAPAGRRRKTLAQVQTEADALALRRTLTLPQLLLLGVGSVIGAGIYVMTGTAAASYAGPSVLIAFLIAALSCVFTAFCYGELCASFPVAGSGYSYAYIIMGERAAWWMGWLSLLEFGISSTAVAAGFSGYANALLATFHLSLPDWLTHPALMTVPDSGGQEFTAGWRFDLLGFLSIVVVTAVLLRGVQDSARFNNVIVLMKVGLLALFVAVGMAWIVPANFEPFVPPSQGDFRYGVGGIFRAASVLFFAYTGFEAVSTAAAEARNPTRDMPLGLVGSLVVCTLIYIAVGAVLVGVVPYQTLNVPDPLAVATRAMHKPWLGLLVMGGATLGLFTGLFAYLYAQSRILLIMAHDRLIPGVFAQLHPQHRTPRKGILIMGSVVALMTATLPFDVIGDFVSLGIAAEYGMVCFSVLWCRNTMPDLNRPFKVPLGSVRVKGLWLGITPILGILFCLIMAVPLALNMLTALWRGNPVPFLLGLAFLLLGWGLYAFFGRKNSPMKD